jgi:nucleotide-binding universal stress UspA family protein
MTLASILAVIDGRNGSEAVLEAALALGKNFASAVELLHVEAGPEAALPMLGENVTGAVVEQVMQSIESEIEQRIAEAKRLYATHCVAAGLQVIDGEAAAPAGRFSVRFKHVTGHEPDEVAARGRLADLVLVARPSAEGAGGDPRTLEAAMFDTGRPVLMVPPGPRGSLGAKIALAWNDSRESARAAAAALPLLRKAGRVVILSARRGDTDAKPSQLARYLALHGIEAETWAFTPKQDPIGMELLVQAAEAGADLLVMGAYGHSRLREFILGGATRSVVAETAIPVLMAH